MRNSKKASCLDKQCKPLFDIEEHLLGAVDPAPQPAD
jgi:hypothetical protein